MFHFNSEMEETVKIHWLQGKFNFQAETVLWARMKLHKEIGSIRRKWTGIAFRIYLVVTSSGIRIRLGIIITTIWGRRHSMHSFKGSEWRRRLLQVKEQTLTVASRLIVQVRMLVRQLRRISKIYTVRFKKKRVKSTKELEWWSNNLTKAIENSKL